MHTNEHRGKPEIHANGWRTTLNGRGRIQELGGKFRERSRSLNGQSGRYARLRNHAFVNAVRILFDCHP